MKIRNTAEIVKEILEQKPRARDCDFVLYGFCVEQVRIFGQHTVQRVGEFSQGGRTAVNGNSRTSEKKGYGTLPVVAGR